MIVIGVVMAWKGTSFFLGALSSEPAPANAPLPANSPGSARPPAWQQDVLSDFSQAAQQAKSGDITSAEVQLDQAAAEMEEARVRSKSAAVDFFSRASAALDDVLKAGHGSSAASGNSDAAGANDQLLSGATSGRLFEHVTQARIELAEMRSSQEALPPGSPRTDSGVDSAAIPAATEPATTEQPAIPAGHVAINNPRELAADETLDPAALRGNFLDASLMPDTSEILLPPESRQFEDNVRVENLTIAGASQTLDGIRWRNVTFVETRLRYEDGPLDLQNVRFVHCTFGFPSDPRGEQIATAITLGQTSLTIQ
jgi:hypothetical protein